MKQLFDMNKGGCSARFYCKNAGKKVCNPTKKYKLFGFIPLSMVKCDSFKPKYKKLKHSNENP